MTPRCAELPATLRWLVTAEGLLCEAETEAKEKYFACPPTRWLSYPQQGVGVVELDLVMVGVETQDGVSFKYWWLRRDYGTGGKFQGRDEAKAAIDDILMGCTCAVLRSPLCVVHGDERDTSVDSCRETRRRIDERVQELAGGAL